MRRFLLTLLLLLIASPSWATGQVFTGFETQGTDMFGVNGTASIVTTQHNSGAASLETNPATTGTGSATVVGAVAAGNRSTTAISAATSFITFYFRWHTKPAASDEEICELQQQGGTMKAAIRLDLNGKLQMYDSVPTGQGNGTAVLSADTWYRIDWKVGTSATVAAWEIKVNGTSDTSGSSANTTATNAGQFLPGKVANRNGNTVDFFYDDIWYDDAAYLGAHSVAILKPRANGTSQTATIGGSSPAATHWQSVNDIPNDGATTFLISSGTATNVETELYDSSATGGVSGTINGVIVFLNCRRDGASNGNLIVRLNSGGTTSDTTGASVSNAAFPTSFFKLYLTDPHTSAAWGTTGLDAVEAGFVENAANKSDVTNMDILVDYTAAAVTTNRSGLTLTGVGCLPIPFARHRARLNWN